MTPEATLQRFRDYMVGPSRFMTLLSCFELGIIDALRDRPGLTAAELGEVAGAKPDAVEQLLLLPVKEGFVAHDEASGAYSLDGLAGVSDKLLEQALADLNMIKAVTLRQLFYLTESVRTGTVAGLKELYGYDGDLYGALGELPELREPWAKLMNTVTAHVDPWFFANVDIPAGSNVLDLAGNTGLGAVNTLRLKGSPGLRVTNFDLPEKEKESLENFRAHGVEDQCSFIGGDVFKEVPKGFDVVLIKHFLPMFDKDDVLRILGGVHGSLEAGAQVHVLVPVFPENLKDTENYTVDFYPSFFVGCTMGQGGPQKLSTWQRWLEESGFQVTRAITDDPANLPPHALTVEAVLSATKVA
ncbi:methyltransferase [Streptomyces sp. NBC_00015]|uniref:methyltransferase n=2 Tax=Streptomyces TaxID=1883 RepID=UPI000368AC35|nr:MULTISPECIES: methyltransferase [unclassified Streptomyces]MCX5372805.1 methyltransferase [Streptomyces sp. NBC_00103]